MNVSKKEVDDLINDILNSCGDLNEFDLQCGVSDFTEYANQLAVDGNLPKQVTVDVDDLNATLVTPVKELEESNSAPETSKNQSQSKVLAASTPSTSNTNISYFDPSKMSTPAKDINTSNQIPSLNQKPEQQSFDSFNSTFLHTSSGSDSRTLINQQFTYQYPTNNYSIGSLELSSPILTPAVLITSTSHATVAMPYAPISSGTITTTAAPSNVISSIQSNENSIEITHLNRQLQAGPVQKKPGHRAKRTRFKSAIYTELENLDPNTIQPKVSAKDSDRFGHQIKWDSNLDYSFELIRGPFHKIYFRVFISLMIGDSHWINVKFLKLNSGNMFN